MKTLDEFLGGKGLSEATQITYRFYLTKLLNYCEDLQTLDAGSFLSWLRQWPEASTSRYIAWCAAKSYLRWQYGSAHPALSIVVKRISAGPQRTLKLAEVERLLAAPDTSTSKGIRDLAILCVMLDTGIRASELTRLELKYLDLEERNFSVLCKGRQWGFKVFTDYTASALAAWLGMRSTVAAAGVGTVFVGIKGIHPGHSLTKDGLRSITYKLALRAGIKRFSPHALRRSFATLATRAGAPGRVVMAAGGWANMAMVTRYTRDIEPADFMPYSPVNKAMGI